MKIIAQIKQLLQHERQQVATKNHSKQTFKNIEYYSTILKFLEAGVSEKHLTKEKERLEKIIKGKEDNFQHWCNYVGYEVEAKKKRQVFNQENNLPYLKKQLKNINFILND